MTLRLTMAVRSKADCNASGRSSSAASLSDTALDILRRTSHHLATTPGGLRFIAGSQAWLQGLPGNSVLECGVCTSQTLAGSS